MQHVAMKVVLGSSSIRAFVAAPKHLKVMGVVRMGQEFGLLAMNEAGTYLRVNGSQNQELDPLEVQRALHQARLSGHQGEDHSLLAPTPRPPSASTPTVAIRKRRRVAHPLLTAH